MSTKSPVEGMVNPQPHYARAAAAASHFKIGRSTLWQWCAKRSGFPQPLRAGPKVSLFDLNAIDAFLRGQH
jgi:predicted DNA-binding transcriptional regulator AlpA